MRDSEQQKRAILKTLKNLPPNPDGVKRIRLNRQPLKRTPTRKPSASAID
ncbi:MAG: hypothetical protein OEQ25_01615 [Gammaproteobacteria bacterium]|nr:hypothetical protein [Gammaproteobacteria bacterium]MDH3505813.1 hypothetical protein [Gammaproteobacteria bacterium]